MKYMNEVVENRNEESKNKDDGADIISGKCPECGSENLVLVFETSNEFHYRCNDCDETFITEIKLLGENIKESIQKNETTERKTKPIRIPASVYEELQTIKQDNRLGTLIEAQIHVINGYKSSKRFEEFETKIINIFNEFSVSTIEILKQFHEDNKVEFDKIRKEIQELKYIKQINTDWFPTKK